MKKTLLSLSLITAALIGKAQICSDLFISEYIEGKGNNKALELYNPTNAPINLSNYRIVRWDNGATVFTPVEGEMVLPGVVIAPLDAFVIALDLTDPAGTGQTAPIDVALEAAADVLLCPGCATGTGNSRVMCFNGDDALSLEKNIGGNWVQIDIFGCIGERPLNSSGGTGAGWTALAPYSSMPVGYDQISQGPYFKQYWTLDKDLKRKSSVTQGVTTNPALQSFNASVQWDSLMHNNYTNLGTHTCDCSTVGLKQLKQSKTFNVAIYPNPVTNDLFTLSSSEMVYEVKILNYLGQTVKNIKNETPIYALQINVADLKNGLYTISVVDKNNKTASTKFIKD